MYVIPNQIMRSPSRGEPDETVHQSLVVGANPRTFHQIARSSEVEAMLDFNTDRIAALVWPYADSFADRGS